MAIGLHVTLAHLVGDHGLARVFLGYAQTDVAMERLPLLRCCRLRREHTCDNTGRRPKGCLGHVILSDNEELWTAGAGRVRSALAQRRIEAGVLDRLRESEHGVFMEEEHAACNLHHKCLLRLE